MVKCEGVAERVCMHAVRHASGFAPPVLLFLITRPCTLDAGSADVLRGPPAYQQCSFCTYSGVRQRMCSQRLRTCQAGGH